VGLGPSRVGDNSNFRKTNQIIAESGRWRHIQTEM